MFWQEEEEIDLAVICLQKLLRGRALQNMVFCLFVFVSLQNDGGNDWLQRVLARFFSTALIRGSEALHSRITQMANSRLDLSHEYILPWLCQGPRHKKPPTSQQGSLYFIQTFWFPLVVSWAPDEERLKPTTTMCRTHRSVFRGTEGSVTKS